MHLNPTDIASLFRTYSSRESFQELSNAVGSHRFLESYLPFAERVASRLSEIPLRQDAYARKGGALACALKAGVLAVKLCDKTIFEPTATAQRRMVGESQYKWLAYSATLATVYLIASNATQIHFEEGEIYSFASPESLVELAVGCDVFWSKRASPIIQTSYILLLELFFSGQFEELSVAILGELAMAINPSLAAPANESPLGKVVRTAIEKTISDDKLIAEREIKGAGGEAFDPPLLTPVEGVLESVPVEQSVESASSSPQPSATKPLPMEITSASRKAMDWLRGLAAMSTLREEIVLNQDGTMSLTRKALGFGAAARDNYQMLLDEKYIHQKVEGGAICTVEARSVFEAALPTMTAEVQQ